MSSFRIYLSFPGQQGARARGERSPCLREQMQPSSGHFYFWSVVLETSLVSLPQWKSFSWVSRRGGGRVAAAEVTSCLGATAGSWRTKNNYPRGLSGTSAGGWRPAPRVGRAFAGSFQPGGWRFPQPEPSHWGPCPNTFFWVVSALLRALVFNRIYLIYTQNTFCMFFFLSRCF